MGDEYREPLARDELAAGRTVRSPDGRDYDILDTLTGGSGNELLVVSDPKGGGQNGIATVVSSGRVRDEWDARDPDEVREERENAGNESVSDETDETDGGNVAQDGDPESRDDDDS